MFVVARMFTGGNMECLYIHINLNWRNVYAHLYRFIGGAMLYLSHEKANMLILSVVERGSNWVLAPTKRTRPAGLLQLGQGGDAPDPRQVSRD